MAIRSNNSGTSNYRWTWAILTIFLLVGIFLAVNRRYQELSIKETPQETPKQLREIVPVAEEHGLKPDRWHQVTYALNSSEANVQFHGLEASMLAKEPGQIAQAIARAKVLTTKGGDNQTRVEAATVLWFFADPTWRSAVTQCLAQQSDPHFQWMCRYMLTHPKDG